VAQARTGERERLPVGSRLTGPIILTQPDTTTWIPVGWEVEVGPQGDLLMTHREGGR
jgi:N-methylhydantoinase A/oxoprolinase/acetone carboxylase beta subunit